MAMSDLRYCQVSLHAQDMTQLVAPMAAYFQKRDDGAWELSETVAFPITTKRLSAPVEYALICSANSTVAVHRLAVDGPAIIQAGAYLTLKTGKLWFYERDNKVSDYSAEDEFYGRTAFDATPWKGLEWHQLTAKYRCGWIEGAKAARAAKYEDPIKALHDELLRDGRATGGMMRVAQRAYELGARAPKDGAK
jgi:hypothetical protein